MDVRMLGPLEVVGETGPISLPRGRGRALLALLALRAGEVVLAEQLVDDLWGPSPPATVRKSLHNLVSGLRRGLRADGTGPSLLGTAGPGYVLHVDPERIDAHRFRQLVDKAAGAPAAQRSAWLRAALDLWRGRALADFAYEPFAQAEIAELEELRLTAVEDRVDADLELGRHGLLGGELEALVAAHPFRERLRVQLMLALYRCGRQADALGAYQQARRALVEELGIEPSPALVDLEQAILRQDPSLALVASGHRRTAVEEPRVEEPRAEFEPWLGAERKTVTVVYAELVEASLSAPDTDPELVRRLLAQSLRAATTTLERHGGTVEGFIGGVVVSVFGVPAAREDDALRAARAGLELREAVEAVGAEAEPGSGARMATRVGISTGEVVVDDAGGGPAPASGDAVTLAGRLQQAAGEGEVLVSEATRRLLGDAARVASVATLVLDRRARPATVWQLLDLSPAARTRTPDLSRPLVGRTRELTRLHAAFQDVCRRRRAARLTVLGEPGVGKSRLALELAAALADEARVLTCRCPAYGEGSTLRPLRELVLQAVGNGGAEALAALLAGQDDAASFAAEIAGATGLADVPRAGRDLFRAVRRLAETLAEQRPLVMLVDDAHWAAPTFLDLVDYLAEAVDEPLLLVCLGRPELGEERRGRPDDAVLVLEPLPAADSERLVVDRLAGRLVPDEVVSQVLELARGNPLFIEQLLAALRDEGKVRLPPSVDALLAARLDLLGPAERDLLRCASVVGAEFSSDALAALVPERARPFLDRHLDALERKELIRPGAREPAGGRSFVFRHVLVQQAAYRSASRQARADLHRRLVDWLEQAGAREHEEVLAHHLEQAHAHRRELGLDDEATRAVAVRAGQRLARAGLRAYERFDMTAAADLLSRARPLLPLEHPQRAEALHRLAEAYPTLGRLADAEAVLDELLADPRAAADPPAAQRLRLEQLRVRLIAGPDPVRHETIRAEVARALEVLEASGDDVGMSRACYLLATMHLRAGEIAELEEVARRGLEHARRSGDLRELLGALWWPSWALVDGSTPVPDAIAAVEALLREGPGMHIGVRTDLARLKAMLGEVDAARALVGDARRDVLEGVRVRRALTVVAHRGAEVELLAGDLDAAEQTLRRGVGVALDVGERDQTALLAASLSLVLSARGASREAASFAAVSQEQAPAESVAAQALWRAATARTLARSGDGGEAERLAREAVALVPAGMRNRRADVLLDLADTLRATGQEQAARSTAQEAADLYERKGNRAGALRAVAAAATR